MDARTYAFTDVSVHKETAKAYLCQIGTGMFWAPKSQIEEFDLNAGFLVMPRWWAERTGAAEAYELDQEHKQQEQEEAWRKAEELIRLRQQPVIKLLKATPVYRKLALKYHPDKNPDSPEMMRDLNELWQAVQADLKTK
jgi:hypothetical protein